MIEAIWAGRGERSRPEEGRRGSLDRSRMIHGAAGSRGHPYLLRQYPCPEGHLADRRQGEIVTLIGANGAGKTTTLNTICGS